MIGHNRIDRKKELLAKLLRLLNHLLAVINLRLIEQGGSDLVALCLQEGVRHTAADDQRIALLKQVGDDVQLISNLCAAKNRDKRALRIVDSIAEILDFLLHQIADNTVTLDILCDTDIGAMCSVSSTKSVIDKDICQGSKLLGELLPVLGLLCSVASILKQNHIPVLHRLNSSLCVRADNVIVRCKLYFLSEQLAQACSNRSQGKLRIRDSLRFSKMRAKDNPSAVCNQLLDRRKCCYQTVLIRDLAILQRNVEVAADQNSLAFYVDVINGLLFQHVSMPPF